MLHAYCVRHAGDPAPDPALAGLGGAAVVLLEEAGLGIWLSPVARAEPTPERLREHDRVVRAALRSATPLPIRFGAALPDEPAARRLLEERREEWRAALERVAGCVEMGVRVGWELAAERAALLAAEPALREPAGAPASGRQFLEQRRRERRLDGLLQTRAQALLARVAGALESVDAPTAQTLLPAPGVAGLLAQLVPRSSVGVYRARFERARAALPEVELSLSGPWAPYSFV